MTETIIPRACVVGWPIKHSRSPIIHNYWLQQLGLDGTYEQQEVHPRNFSEFIKSMPEAGYVGCNVTIPHKEAAFALCQHISPTATAVGAVNTLWIKDGELHADNTDVSGFLDNLDSVTPGWDKQTHRALVLGAGGAARSVILGLLQRGGKHISVINRTADRANLLSQRFGKVVSAENFADMPSLLRNTDLLVNTTSLGMHGQPKLEIDLGPLPAHAIVADIVYVPLETSLLAQARSRGLRTVDGLGMLLHQATRGFEQWFGARPKVTPELRAIVMNDILRSL